MIQFDRNQCLVCSLTHSGVFHSTGQLERCLLSASLAASVSLVANAVVPIEPHGNGVGGEVDSSHFNVSSTAASAV